MTDLADMTLRVAEREELDRLRVENARLRRRLEEERNPLLRAARMYQPVDLSHPEVVRWQAHQMMDVRTLRPFCGIGAAADSLFGPLGC